MSAQTVAQSLAYVNWTVLLGLGVGSFAFVVLLRRVTDATRGYLSFTAGCAAALGTLAWLADTGLPSAAGLAIVRAPTQIDQARQVAVLAFTAASALAMVAVRRDSRLGLVGPLGVGLGIAAFALAAFGWSAQPTDAVPLFVQYVVLAAVTGGTLAALILGHWYLVTPRLSERPLLLATRILTLSVALQLLLFATWALFGTGSAAGSPPLAVLTGGAALFVWLRLIVSLVGPLILSSMAERTARTRSMESATGLLYIDLAAVASGTIVASALAYTTGVLV